MNGARQWHLAVPDIRSCPLRHLTGYVLDCELSCAKLKRFVDCQSLNLGAWCSVAVRDELSGQTSHCAPRVRFMLLPQSDLQLSTDYGRITRLRTCTKLEGSAGT